MLHARKPSSGADSFIKRVAGGGPAKAFAVARAESLDRLLVQKRFGDRQQGETFDPAGGALIRRIERPDAFDLVPEEVEPQRVFLACGKQVQKAAAHGELACLGHRIGADIAEIGRASCRERVWTYV